MERLIDSKLVEVKNGGQNLLERVKGQWGRSPTYMGPQKCDRYELNSRSSGTTATCSGTTADVLPRGVLAVVTAVLPPGENCRKPLYENGRDFCIRTPFSMFLGSLKSQRRALQEYADKHHSTTWEDKTK